MAVAGDYAGAASMLERALPVLRGQQSETESRVCGNLGSIYASVGRRFEGILLWRRGLNIADALDLRLLGVRHCANLCGGYAALELWEVLRAQWQQSEERIEALPEEERAGARDLFLWPRVYLALQDGDAVLARELSRAFHAAYGERRDPTSRALAAVMRADIMAAHGEPDRALEILAAAEVIQDLPLLDRIYVACQTVEHLKDADRLADARARARQVLAWLDDPSAELEPGDLGIHLALDLGRLLAGDPAQAEAAQRAFDLAAESVLARIASLDEAARRMPELCELPPGDFAWIADLRVLYQRHQADLVESVTRLLGDPQNAPELFLGSDDPADAYLRICAWCSRVGTRNGRWLPLAHYLPTSRAAPVSHGICRECRHAAMGPATTS